MALLRSILRSNLKLKHLNLLVALDDIRHIGKVADYLHLTQPAVSKTLAEIESLLDVQLFDRSSRGTHPTRYGDALVRFARETLASLDRVGDELDALERGSSGRVDVGVMMFAAAVLVPRSVGRMKQRSPHTSVRIEDGLIEPLLSRLRLGELDMVVGRIEPALHVPELHTQALFDEPIVMVTHPDNPIARRTDIGWDELARQPWIVPPPGSSARTRFDVVLGQQGQTTPADVAESGSFLPLFTLVRERRALSILANSAARYWEALGLLSVLPIPFPSTGGAVGIITLRSHRLTPAAELLADCLREIGADINASHDTPIMTD